MRHLLISLGLVALACEPTPPGDDDGGWRPEWPEFEVRYETEHIRVAPSFEQPICQGSLDAMERHVVMVADALEIGPGPVTVFWFNDEAQGADVDASRGECFPCFKYDAVYSNAGAMMHELVHATVSPVLGQAETVLAEGVAYGLDGEHVFERVARATPPSESIQSEAASARFIRWVLSTWGPGALHELFARAPRGTEPPDVASAFEAVGGNPMASIDATFLETAPSVYPAPGVCDGLPTVAWDAGSWSIDTDVDCAADNVFGPTDDNPTGTESIGAVNVFAAVMEVPPEIIGRELEVERDPDLPQARGMPCLDEPMNDPDVAKTLTFSSVLSGYTLALPRYRVEIPAGPDGRASLRLTLR